jgi:ATP-dependent Lon protease
VVVDYTRESGVRNLEKKIGSVIRGVAKNIALEEEPYNPAVSKKDVEKILGAPIFDKDLYENNNVAGVVTGLSMDICRWRYLFIEASLSPGKGKLTLTGSLGDVMKESVIIALGLPKGSCQPFQYRPERLFDLWDMHVHVPAGATPKDGPSAGVTMLTALTIGIYPTQSKT